MLLIRHVFLFWNLPIIDVCFVLKILEIIRVILKLYDQWKNFDDRKEIAAVLNKMPKPKPPPNRYVTLLNFTYIVNPSFFFFLFFFFWNRLYLVERIFTWYAKSKNYISNSKLCLSIINRLINKWIGLFVVHSIHPPIYERFMGARWLLMLVHIDPTHS